MSATYLDYPKAAERAAQLLPSAKVVILLREPTSRLVSSFNMKWQVHICAKLLATHSRFTTHYSTTHDSQLTTHDSLLTTHDSRLTTHNPPPTTHHSTTHHSTTHHTLG